MSKYIVLKIVQKFDYINSQSIKYCLIEDLICTEWQSLQKYVKIAKTTMNIEYVSAWRNLAILVECMNPNIALDLIFAEELIQGDEFIELCSVVENKAAEEIRITFVVLSKMPDFKIGKPIGKVVTN